MVKRWIVFLFLSVFLISLVSAVPPVSTITSTNSFIQIVHTPIEYAQANETLYLRFWVFNSTNGVPITNITSYCTLNLLEPQGKNIFRNGNVSFNPSKIYPNSCINCFYQDLNPNNFTNIGLYSINIRCQANDNSLGGDSVFSFEVNYIGDELSTGTSIFYAVLIFLMILLLAGTIYGAERLPSANDKDEEGKIMSVKLGKYLRAPLYFIAWIIFIAILFITSNLAFAYLGEQLFAKVLFNLYKICFAITPVIVVVWFVWFFVKIFQDKKLNGYISRGLYPQEKKSKW
jgi:hypothetical protein